MIARAGDPDIATLVADIARSHPRCVWLDGGGVNGWVGQRSLVGWLTPDDVSLTYDAASGEVHRHVGDSSTVVGDDVFTALRHEIEAAPRPAQWFGYFGFASRPDLPARGGGTGDVPDAIWMRPSQVRIFDHPTPTGPSPRPPADATSTPEPDTSYGAAFEQVQSQLRAGNSYEVNLTMRERIASDLSPLTAYRRLRALNPAPYAGFLQHDVQGAAGWLLSSSPERFAVIDADRSIEVKPIKGTLPRLADRTADLAAAERLASDPKFRAENLMITDLLRNDLAMVCEPGSVEVPQLMQVESYATVHQLVSTITGRLVPEIHSLDALRSIFPAGSMTGAPKLRTMEIIEAVEADQPPRGAYAGAFGWISSTGEADLGVVIRTLTTDGSGTYTLGTGGGITVDSDVDEEFAEAQLKAARLRAVFA